MKFKKDEEPKNNERILREQELNEGSLQLKERGFELTEIRQSFDSEGWKWV